MGTLYEDLPMFILVSRSLLLRMRNFSNKICRETQNTHFMFNNFFPENRVFHELMRKNMLEPDGP